MENREIARRWNEQLFNAGGDIDTADAFVAADLVDHSAPPGMPGGREGVKAQARLFRSAFPDIWSRVTHVVADGDLVATRWEGGGTHQGAFFGIPPTGRTGATTGTHLFRIADGMSVEHWSNSDDLGMLRSLGVIP